MELRKLPVMPEKEAEVKDIGMDMIVRQRAHQFCRGEFLPEFNNTLEMGELIGAAMCYVGHAYGLEHGLDVQKSPPKSWPLDKSLWNPSDDPCEDLAKAGAIIVAHLNKKQHNGNQD